MAKTPTPTSDHEFTVATADGALLRVHTWDAGGGHEVGAGNGVNGSEPVVPTLVLAHGWTMTHRSWLPVIERIRAVGGISVIAYDQRGHGRSTPGEPPISVRRLGADLAEVIGVAAPTGPLVLAGHSMGGMALLAYAGLHPTEVRDRVRGVGLVATSAGDLGGTESRLQDVGVRVLARVPGLHLGRFITDSGQRRLLFGPHAEAAAVRLTRDQVASTPLSTFGGYYAAMGEHDEVASLAALEGIPVEILVGEQDRMTPPRHSAALADLIPQARLQVLPDCGHMLPYEATGEVVEALLWLLGVSDVGR